MCSGTVLYLKFIVRGSFADVCGYMRNTILNPRPKAALYILVLHRLLFTMPEKIPKF